MPTANTSAPLVNTISAASGSPKIWSPNISVRKGEGGKEGRRHVWVKEGTKSRTAVKDLFK